MPIIYARGAGGERATVWVRLLGLGVAFSCLGVLAVAARLPPNPRGMSSHTALGLQPCEFLDRAGLPCPSCGMTTSFAWFVRGNVPASLYVQPMGTVLAALAGACVWAGLYLSLTGRPVYRLLYLRPGRYYFVPLLAVGVAAWAWKILIHLRGIDGWG